MKTLILNGSPRAEGDTAALLKVFRAGLRGECLQIDAYGCGISPCVDCRACRTAPGCAIRDGMQAVYDYIIECDRILIASPVYFSELTGRLLDVASRLQTFYCARFFRKEEPIIKPKRGAVILVGGGDGRIERAYGTARVLLRQMNCREIHGLVSSHNTNETPAAEDARALEGVKSVIGFFNAE